MAKREAESQQKQEYDEVALESLELKRTRGNESHREGSRGKSRFLREPSLRKGHDLHTRKKYSGLEKLRSKQWARGWEDASVVRTLFLQLGPEFESPVPT